MVFSDVRVAKSLVFYVVFCRSLFLLFYLSFNLRLLISHLISSNFTFQSFDLERSFRNVIPETHHAHEITDLRFLLPELVIKQT